MKYVSYSQVQLFKKYNLDLISHWASKTLLNAPPGISTAFVKSASIHDFGSLVRKGDRATLKQWESWEWIDTVRLKVVTEKPLTRINREAAASLRVRTNNGRMTELKSELKIQYHKHFLLSVLLLCFLVWVCVSRHMRSSKVGVW